LKGSGSLNLLGFNTETFNLILSKDGLFLDAGGSPKLKYGNVNIPFNVFWLDSSGLREFGGSLGGATDWKAFGRKLDGSPGHPYAKLDWNVSAGYNSQNRTIFANVSGTLTVEYERFGGYSQKSFGFGPQGLGTNGSVSVSPGESFSNISVFSFTL
jgi:hypothetical protein